MERGRKATSCARLAPPLQICTSIWRGGRGVRFRVDDARIPPFPPYMRASFRTSFTFRTHSQNRPGLCCGHGYRFERGNSSCFVVYSVPGVCVCLRAPSAACAPAALSGGRSPDARSAASREEVASNECRVTSNSIRSPLWITFDNAFATTPNAKRPPR